MHFGNENEGRLECILSIFANADPGTLSCLSAM